MTEQQKVSDGREELNGKLVAPAWGETRKIHAGAVEATDQWAWNAFLGLKCVYVL